MKHITDVNEFCAQLASLHSAGFFEAVDPIWIARSPGRLDFFGGNVDYTGGLVLQLPLRESVHAAAQISTEPVIRILNPSAERSGWAGEILFPAADLGSLEAIQKACSDPHNTRWGRYVLGAFHYLYVHHEAFHRGGARMVLDSDLIPNRGLASSAALEIAVLKAASAAVNIPLEGVALAEAGQWVENVVAGSACGIMDQAACVLGKENCLLPLLCQPCLPDSPLSLPAGARIWGIDSLASRATASAAYEAARAAAFMGYRMICHWEGVLLKRDPSASIPRWTDSRWHGYLSNLRPSELCSRFDAQLPNLMPGSDYLALYGEHVDPFTTIEPTRLYPVRAAVRYASEEHERVETACNLLRGSNASTFEDGLARLGKLMYQSHAAYGECGLGSPACDALIELARKHGLYGAKMTGGGGGGVVALLGTTDQEDAVAAVVDEYAQICGGEPAVFTGSSNGADMSRVIAWEPSLLLTATSA